MRRNILSVLGFAVCCSALSAALPAPASADVMTPEPPPSMSANASPISPLAMPAQQAQGQPTSLTSPDAPPLPSDTPGTSGAMVNAPMSATPVGTLPVPPVDATSAGPQDSSASAVQQPMPMTAQPDPMSSCQAAGSDSSVGDCLKKMSGETDTQLTQAEADKLKVLRSGSDWKQGKIDARQLVNSAMGFEAYRDSECARQKTGHKDEEADNIYMSCQIKMSQARIATLQQP